MKKYYYLVFSGIEKGTGIRKFGRTALATTDGLYVKKLEDGFAEIVNWEGAVLISWKRISRKARIILGQTEGVKDVVLVEVDKKGKQHIVEALPNEPDTTGFTNQLLAEKDMLGLQLERMKCCGNCRYFKDDDGLYCENKQYKINYGPGNLVRAHYVCEFWEMGRK